MRPSIHFRTAAILWFTTLLLTSACNKSDDGPNTPSSTSGCGTVSGIVQRDNMGAPMGPTDANDWRFEEPWCPAVDALFADLPPVTYVTNTGDSLWAGAWPNPTSNQFMLGFWRADTGHVDVRFVNSQHALLGGRDTIRSQTILFRADTLGITTPQTIRAYYRVVHPDGTAHRGYGDIQLQ
ncbi:MAG: hypothetical protein JNL52_05745 [Flavobacteriales bacterium]|nr:hypothetical protein [Flavobacteriales bacterium]